MKNYNVKYSLNKPTDRSIYVSKNSVYCISLNVLKNGEKVDDIKLYDGNTELSSSGTFVGDPQYSLTADSNVSRKILKVNSGNQFLNLFINTTDSDVAELGQGQGGGSEYVLPVASSTTLGGVKVNGNGVSIAADGTLSVDTPSLDDYATKEYVDNAISGIEIPTKTSDLTNDSGFLSAETDPIFTSWKSGDGVVVGNNASGVGAGSVAIGKNAEANGSDSVALGYNAYVDGNTAVQLGQGVNQNDGTLQFGSYQIVDDDGNIPSARLGGITTAVLSGTYDDDSTFTLTCYVK